MTHVETNVEGNPLRIHDLDIEKLALYLNEKKVKTTQGKIYQPLHKAHLQILEDGSRFKVLACGRRFGKTFIVTLMILAAMMQPSRRCWVVAPDYTLCEKVFRELYSILVHQLKLIVPGKKGRARYQKGDYYLETPWGSVLEGKTMENPDSLAGDANDLVIVDEAAIQTNIEDIWTQMLKPTLMDKSGSAIFISTPRGKNTFYKLFLNGQLGSKQREGKIKISYDRETQVSNDMRDWSSFQKTSYDNPLLAGSPEQSKREIDDSYREAILAGKLTSFKQEYLADFEAVSDSCFPNFFTEKTEAVPFPHVVDYIWHPDEGPVFAACDHNFAKPASTIFAQVNSYGDVIIFDELFTPKTTSYMQAQQIVEKEAELTRNALDTWQREMAVQSQRHHIKFDDIVADVSGDQVQLNGRSAWDDMAAILGRRPVGLKQPREVGSDMIRLWMNYPQFDSKGRPLKRSGTNEPVTAPKLYINRNCVNLIYALSTATFKKGKSGILKEDYEETPTGHEGLIDALRYLLVHLFHDTGEHFTIVQGVQ